MYFFVDPLVSTDNPQHSSMWNPKIGNPLLNLLYPLNILRLTLVLLYVYPTNNNSVPAIVPSIEALKGINNESFNATTIVTALKGALPSGISTGELFKSFRYLLTGTNVGATVPETIETLGKDVAIRRLEKGIHLS